MSLTIQMLRSGSSGNAALISHDDGTHVLIDAGIGPRVLTRELAAHGLAIRDLAGAVFTHCHSDHVRGNTLGMLAREGVPLHFNQGTWAQTRRRLAPREQAALGPEDARIFEETAPFVIGGLELRACRVHHGEPGPDNAAGDPVCFTLTDGSDTVGYATDLGHVTPELLAHLRPADLLVLESNHDPEMLRFSPRPEHVRRWIASDAGHLRNDQAATCLRSLFEGREGVGVILAHLSELCNTHGLAREASRAALEDVSEATIGVAERHTSTVPWVLERGRVRLLREQAYTLDAPLLAWPVP